MSQVSPPASTNELSSVTHESTTVGEPVSSATPASYKPGYWATRKARKAARKAQRRSIIFKITAEGMMLLLIAILVGFAAWHSGANLLYLLFSIHVAIFLLNGFMLSINLTRLHTIEQAPELVVARQPFNMAVQLENRKRFFASRSISVAHYLENSRKRLGTTLFLNVPPQGTAEETYQATLPRRGLYRISRSAVSTRYPFGFEERGQVFATTQQLLALPETYPISPSMLQAPLGFGDQESEVRGSGTDLYGLREYVQGEPARHVHWRTSARAQKLMVAEYTREERRQVYLVLDNATPADDRHHVAEPFEKAVILTASLARHLIDTGFEVGLVTQDTVMTARQGSTHLTSILRHLALIDLVDGTPLTPVRNALQVTYNGDQPTHTPDGTFSTIDSRNWNPPQYARQAGEKAV